MICACYPFSKHVWWGWRVTCEYLHNFNDCLIFAISWEDLLFDIQFFLIPSHVFIGFCFCSCLCSILDFLPMSQSISFSSFPSLLFLILFLFIPIPFFNAFCQCFPSFMSPHPFAFLQNCWWRPSHICFFVPTILLFQPSHPSQQTWWVKVGVISHANLGVGMATPQIWGSGLTKWQSPPLN